MTDTNSVSSTRTSRVINASPETLYRAFIDPAALEIWLAPEGMTGKVHDFDARIGRGYRMSLFYTSSEATNRGKTSATEDRFTAQFVELTPAKRIVQAITFDTTEAAFAGQMFMVVIFEATGDG